MITVIDYLREQGVDPFEIAEDGRPLWEVLDEQCRVQSEARGLVPVVTDRLAWHEGLGGLSRVVEWQGGNEQ